MGVRSSWRSWRPNGFGFRHPSNARPSSPRARLSSPISRRYGPRMTWLFVLGKRSPNRNASILPRRYQWRFSIIHRWGPASTLMIGRSGIGGASKPFRSLSDSIPRPPSRRRSSPTRQQGSSDVRSSMRWWAGSGFTSPNPNNGCRRSPKARPLPSYSSRTSGIHGLSLVTGAARSSLRKWNRSFSRRRSSIIPR